MVFTIEGCKRHLRRRQHDCERNRVMKFCNARREWDANIIFARTLPECAGEMRKRRTEMNGVVRKQ